ncbi:MAG: outer membrane protein assembly factor BamE [Magnetovibrio sp.]|nr:outer membrane protein assembly factor BamE [Magnetovibrio sp.]
MTLLLGACAPRVETRGNSVNIEDVATIKIGTHTRRNVFELLGSPSNQSAFGEETWYYISQLTETTAFLVPVIKESQVVTVKFDTKGVVTFVDVLNTDKVEAIIPAEGATPTAGNSLSFFDQILSNLGRFNKK